MPLFPPIPIIINLNDKTKDISSNLRAYMSMQRCLPSFGDLALGLKLVRPGCGLDDVLSVDDDNVSTTVGVLGGDVAFRELCVLRLDNDLVGTTGRSRMEEESTPVHRWVLYNRKRWWRPFRL